MGENGEKTILPERNPDGTFQKGYVGGPGRPPETEQDKIRKKVIKELVREYKEGLAEALSEIKPVLIEKAKSGDIQAIKEINDIVVEKAVRRTDLTSGDRPIPILDAFHKDNSPQEDNEAE